MKEEIKIPAMGESVTEATIGTFLKANGEFVSEGEELIELETEKVNQVLYAPLSGLVTWNIQESESVKIGQVIGFVESAERPQTPPKEEKKERVKPTPEQKPVPEKPPGNGKRIMADDFVKELQKPEPEISKPPPPPLPKPGNRRKMSKIRQTIARRLVDSLHSAAMLTTFNEVDMSTVMALRTKYQEKFSEKYGVKLGLTSFFVKAVVEGLKKFPDLNSFIEGDEIVTHEHFNIAIAVGTDRGLVVPVLRQCENKSFAEIEKEIKEYAQKARNSKLSISDLEGGGFTITNGGVYGSLLSTPILNPPQTGILGMHKIIKRAVVVEDAIVIRPMMYLALSYDHRLIDGKEAVSFLVYIKEILEDPTRLIFFDDV